MSERAIIRAAAHRCSAAHRLTTQNGAGRRAVASRSATRCRRGIDDRWKEWERYASARRALTRARVKRKNARHKIAELEKQIAVQRRIANEAEQMVLELWPKVPPEQRGFFNDDLELLADSPAERANGRAPAPASAPNDASSGAESGGEDVAAE